eukprot:428328-Lingulodinium_polyedra.AAC.1
MGRRRAPLAARETWRPSRLRLARNWRPPLGTPGLGSGPATNGREANLRRRPWAGAAARPPGHPRDPSQDPWPDAR